MSQVNFYSQNQYPNYYNPMGTQQMTSGYSKLSLENTTKFYPQPFKNQIGGQEQMFKPLPQMQLANGNQVFKPTNIAMGHTQSCNNYSIGKLSQLGHFSKMAYKQRKVSDDSTCVSGNTNFAGLASPIGQTERPTLAHYDSQLYSRSPAPADFSAGRQSACSMRKMSGEQYPDMQSGESTNSCATSDAGDHDLNAGVKLESNIYSDVQNNLFDSHDCKDDASHVEYCEATRGTRKKAFMNAEERQVFRQQYEQKKKTELCRNFEMYGKCKFGDSCSYAHGRHQLQKKTHLPSNFMTKLCTQFHEDGVCLYGERCQFLHSIYDLKTPLSYCQALAEGARLTQKRNEQISAGSGAECLWANLKTGDGCGAPKKPRLACFEAIYNKDQYQEQQAEKRGYEPNNFITSDSNVDYSFQPKIQYMTRKPKVAHKSGLRQI